MFGNDAVLLTPEERAALPAKSAEHTHRWTVALRSAPSPHPDATPAEQPTRIGGVDDYSYFIKKVQFKLHETIPNSLRTLDKPPWEVTETGWGEFDLQIKVFFVNEAYEKPLQFYHHLKLHPWNPALLAYNASDPPSVPTMQSQTAPGPAAYPEDEDAPGEEDDEGDTTMPQVKDEAASPPAVAAPEPEAEPAANSGSALASGQLTPSVPLSPVYSWQYDEIVFTEPSESLFRLLTQHPPTALPQAPRFETETVLHPSGNGKEFSTELQASEATRLEKVRKDVMTELESWRMRLTKVEQKKEQLNAASSLTRDGSRQPSQTPAAT